MQFQTLKIKAKDADQRLDLFLSAHLKISRAQIQKMEKKGYLWVNQVKAKKSGQKIETGDVLRFPIPDSDLPKKKSKISKLSKAETNLEILFENADLLVISKPPGLVVHPSETKRADTLVDLLQSQQKKLSQKDQMRPGIVHRLDKDTSGALIIAKNNKIHEELAKAFKNREIQKTYLTLVAGHPKSQEGTIEAPIKRSTKDRKRMAIHNQGRFARTHFKVLEQFKSSSLLEIRIETGRTHQIRVHLASIGFPVIGDTLYGNSKINEEYAEKYGIHRQFLHASELVWKKFHFKAPLSKDLDQVLKHLKSKAMPPSS